MLHNPLSKLFLRLFAPVTVLLLAGVYFYGQAEISRDLSRLERQDVLNVALGAAALSRSLHGITGDLYFLAGHSALRAALDEPTPQHLDQLAERFADFSRSKGVYDQVRWIDETGRERVRVDLVRGEAVLVAADRLQIKGRRYYFSDSFRLKPGEIFVSPLDLNVEEDRIELPYKPMLRVATPVTDSRGAKRGIVILNYFGRVMLDAFAEATTAIAGRAMLVNGDGYWLKGPKQGDEWGFMFKRADLSLAAQAPAAWAQIRAVDNGQAVLADGLWTWESVYPVHSGETSSTGAVEAFAPSAGAVKSKQYVWKSIAHVPGATLSALRRAVWLKLAAVAAVLLGLLGFGAWKLAHAWAALAAAEAKLRALNAGLEARVNERTLELRDKVAALDAEIVERRRTENALKASEDRFRKAFELNPDAININRLEDGRYVSINRGFARIMGYTEDEIIGHTSIEFNIWDDPEDRVRLVQGLNSDGAVANLEARFRAKDGSIHDGLMSAAVVEIEGVPHIISITRDITHRKRAQEALRESEARLRLTTEMAEIAVWEYDFQAGQMSRSANHDKLYGLPWQDHWNIDTFLQATHPDDRERGNEMIQASTAPGGPDKYAFDFRVVWPDASVHWLWASGEMVKRDANGRGLLVRGVLVDISERKAAEAKIQRLTRIYAALSQCNQAIVRCASEEELFREICRVAVEFGGMKMAWIGFVDQESRIVRPVTSFGDRADEYLQGAEFSVDADRPFGRGPTSITIRENQPTWRQDFLSEPLTAPWQKRRARFPFRASASLPLHRDGIPAGVLTLYAGEVGAFDEAARQLLTEMAADIDFALDNFAREAERARAQQELRAAEEQFRGLVEQSIAGICIIQDGKYVYVNPRFAEIRGYGSTDELIGREVVSMVAEQDRGAFADKMRQLLAGEMRSVSSTHTALRKNGSRVQVGANMALATYRGRPAIVGMLQDISEKERAEEALRASEEKFAKAFRSSPMLMAISTVAGDRIIEVNDGFLHGTGLSRVEVINHTVQEIDLWKTPRDRQRAIDSLLRDGRISGFKAELRKRSGESMACEIWGELIVIDNRPCVIWVINDVTKRNRTEDARNKLELQLRESQKMEALGTLAGGIAHDFNNIVAAIMGNVELARQDVGPGHAALNSLEEILKASRRAKDLVRQILAFGRRQVLERRVISLAPAVEESARLLRATLPAGVSLSVDCAPDAPAVLADATQVEQVLLNLCANAWQAMRGQERPAAIEISLAPYLANGAPYVGPERRSRGGRVALCPGRYACLMVRDTGPGMDHATRSRIFEPFFTTKPAGEGTGLGLAVVHGIAQDHRASIAVQTAPGEGATFRIYFPAVDATADPAQGARPEPAPRYASHENGAALLRRGQGKSILYVDDDESIVFLMTRLLERRGYRVSAYTDPLEALAAVRAEPGRFDLAVTDYNMPGMSGLDVAHALREIRADLPVAMASGYITEELRAQAPAAGVIELLYKPDSVDELCEVVARLAKSHRGKEHSS